MPERTSPDETTSPNFGAEGSDFRQLDEDRDAVTDWRERVRSRPELWLGVAFVGGMLVAGALKTRSGERVWSAVGAKAAAGGRDSVQAQVREFWHNLQGALVGVASARIQQYIDGVVPGFNEHYRRAEHRGAGGHG